MSGLGEIDGLLRPSQILKIATWALLGLGALFALVGLSTGVYAWLILSCLISIVARMAQAEYQFREAERERQGGTAP